MATAVGTPAMASCACRGLDRGERGVSILAGCGTDWNGDLGRDKSRRRTRGLVRMARRDVDGGFGVSRTPRRPGSFLGPSEEQQWRNSREFLEKFTMSKVKLDSSISRATSPRFCRLGLRANQQQTWDNSSLQTSESCCPSAHKTSSRSAMSRRVLMGSVLLGSTTLPFLLGEKPASASSYREYVDRLDGYIFSYPPGWIQVRGAGADVFFRDPINLDENVVVDFSSPSSSRYKSVEDLGTPQQAAQKVLKQKILEFMSTRLGVRRESNIVSANSRVGEDGRLYYDIEVDVKSYASTNELAVMPGDRVQKLEWSRRYLSTLGVENNRLYELRLQAPEKVLAKDGMGLRQIMNSFQLVKLEG